MQDSYIEVDGIRTRYWHAGDQGPAVVLLHGIASSVEDWEGTIPALMGTHRVFALDMLGCGKTDKPATNPHDQEALKRHVLGFMDAMGIEQADLIGWSMGGRIALDCAHSVPSRVRRLVLTAPAGVGPDTIINFRMATLPMLGELLTKPNKMGMRILMNAALHDGTMMTDDHLEARLDMARLPGAQTVFLKQLRSFVGLGGFRDGPRQDVLSWLPAISVPTLAIWGRQDRFVPPAHADVLADAMTDCRVAYIDACGHVPQFEHPEIYNRLVVDFLG